MNIETIFTVKNEHLNQLDQKTAVEFFQKLLWAEARKLGVEISKINVSNWINVPDGGVDANVNDAQITAGQGLIKQGKTSYQIKAGATFKPWQKSVIKKELFGTKDPERQNLGESIKSCLDTEGTYILVCTGIDPVEPQREKIRSHIEEYLKQCDYPHPKADVFTQSTLRGFLDSLPSLALSLNGNDKTTFQSHQSWSLDDTMKHKFVSGPAQKNLLTKIRRKLRTNNEAIHIRILGESGSGKSKLVLNATRVKDLSPLVIHCEASQFKDSDLLNHILRDDNHFDVILVVDECNSNDRSYIWDKLKNRGSRIKLITISNDYEEKTADLIPEKMPLLKEKYIRKILIQEYQIHDRAVYQWAEFCSGLPGVAHIIGTNLNSHQENLLAPLSTVNFWERCIVGGDDPTSQDVVDRWSVLRYLALFKQFGFKGNVSHEFSAISEIVENAFPSITRQRFRKIVLDLKKRGILKGNYTLHITPKAFHIKLWLEWWENYYDEDFDFTKLMQGFSQELHNWFCDMFRYAAESDEAIKIVKQLLGPNGPFQSDAFLMHLSSRFFLALTDADPASALECLKQTIEKCDKETLLQFTDRRNVVWALEKIAVWETLFPDAARLLLALGEAENETWSNNASGVFAGLFSLAYDPLAPTAASPEKRFPILKEAFESDSKAQRLLALKACEVALQPMDRWRRTIVTEYQGLRKPPKLWKPKTYGDLWNLYRQVWQLLFEQVELLPIDERNEAINILLEQVHWLGEIRSLSNMVIDTIRKLAKNPFVDNRLLIKTVVEFLHYKGKDISNKMQQHWEQLEDELVGPDFHSMMERYVGMSLRIDLVGENGNYLEQGHPKIHDLAQQAIDNPELLEPELHWLVTTEAYNGWAFGYQLGKKDDGFVLLSILLDAQRKAGNNGSAFFLGGYFRSIFESDITKWEIQLDTLVQDPKLNKLILELTYRSGLTDKAGLRLLKLAQKSVINVINFHYFVGGNIIANLSENVFTEWIKFMLSAPDELAVSVALKLYYHYYIYEKEELTLPIDLTFQLLSRPASYENLNSNMLNSSMTGPYWSEIGKAFLRIDPKKGLELVKHVLEHFGKDGTIFGTFSSETHSVLTEVTKQYPAEVWKHVSKYLETGPDFECPFFLEKWLKGKGSWDMTILDENDGALTLIPQEKIWKWVDKDLENRAWYLAYRIVPKTLSVEKWKTSLARAILVQYGEREDVRNNLRANYSTGSWKGELSLHLDQKREKLLHIKECENNVNVIRWIEKYIEILEKGIEDAKISEEREY